jgi:hypothetical protein
LTKRAEKQTGGMGMKDRMRKVRQQVKGRSPWLVGVHTYHRVGFWTRISGGKRWAHIFKLQDRKNLFQYTTFKDNCNTITIKTNYNYKVKSKKNY